MACCFKFKTYLTALLVFYTVYLFSYKCPSLKESGLEHSSKVLIHPFSHAHNQVCEGLNTGSDFVAPYVAKAHEFLDTHVHSHPLFKKYEIEEKIQLAKAYYFSHAYPYVVQVWQFVEIAEHYIFVQSHKLYTHLEGHFHATVVPKVNEIKNAVFGQ